ncbi:MAG TPA: VWA domain-containing protein [Candidatus Eisenbacteria bacterium]|nr:VWA domain-containing protein [Candidatus Eisenbacteria bacterium]
MIDWGDARFLILGLAVLGLLAALFARARRKRRWALDQMVGTRLTPRLAGTVLERAVRWRAGLRFLALTALVIAAAGPRWGRQVVKVSGQGSDLVFVMDVSYSMDVRDVPPSRIEEAKREAQTLLDGLTGDRVGLIAFAGDAAVLTPLTLDYSAVRILLGSLSTGSVSHPGTDLGGAIKRALDLLPKSRPGEQAIVIFTDGEDLAGAGRAEALVAARRGIRVFTVGVGTPAGETIPVYDEGGREIGRKRGPDGEVVISHLDEDLLRDIARSTHGAYFAASHPGGEVPRLRLAVARVERGKREGRLGTRPVERFALFAWIAWIAWMVSLLLPARLTKTAIEAARKTAAVLLLCLLVPRAASADALRDGNAAYARGDYPGAVEAYKKGLAKKPGDAKLLANLGSALYRMNDWNGSQAVLEQAASRGAGRLSDREQARILYNWGNSLFRKGSYPEAAEAYRRSLEHRPDDADARFNYESALARIQAPPTPPPQPKGGGGGGGGGQGQGSSAQPPPQPAPPSPSQAQQQARQPAPVPGRLTKQDAERLLDALSNEEAETQKKKNKARSTVEPKGPDW